MNQIEVNVRSVQSARRKTEQFPLANDKLVYKLFLAPKKINNKDSSTKMLHFAASPINEAGKRNRPTSFAFSIMSSN